MKPTLLVLFMLMTKGMLAQEYRPFAEADKAIAQLNQAPEVLDSLKRIYQGRWTIGFTLGQRRISNRYLATPDSVTLADFTAKTGYLGLESGYFISNRWYIGLGIDVLILPRVQEIANLSISSSGISAEASGNGGIQVSMNMVGKYYFSESSFTRPYAAIKLGRANLIAKGGEFSISSNSNTIDGALERRSTLRTSELLVGLSHRLTPVTLVDLNIGMVQSSRSTPIGGVTGTGGFKSSITIQFLINAKKEK